jgi:hypothetical protein
MGLSVGAADCMGYMRPVGHPESFVASKEPQKPFGWRGDSPLKGRDVGLAPEE